MAAARSPCGGFKTRVLHFKVKNSLLKDKKMERGSSKECSVFFSWRMESSSSRNLPSRISTLFSSQRSAWSVLKCSRGSKGGISYIPWCIASYYIIKLPNARDPISSTRTRQLNNGGKRFVLPIKPSVPLMCRSIYDFRFTIPNLSLVKSKRVFWPRIIN